MPAYFAWSVRRSRPVRVGRQHIAPQNRDHEYPYRGLRAGHRPERHVCADRCRPDRT